MKQNDWRNKFNTPSRLDSFQMYKYGVNWRGDLYSDDDYCRTLLKLDPPSNKIQVGTILHEVIENSSYGRLSDKFNHGGWEFNILCDFELAIPEQREVKLSYALPNGAIMNGKVDAIASRAVHDYKFTSIIDNESYLTSWQWRAYLVMAYVNIFVYDIIKVKIDEPNFYVEIIDYERLELHSYPTMKAQLFDFIDEYYTALELLKPMLIDMSHSNKLNNVFTITNFKG